MRATKITIVRHGETEWNVAQRLQGHSDSQLTTKGLKQAELLANTIKYRKFDRIISSDLGRAIETTSIIAEHIRAKRILNKQLRERSFGVMEGMPIGDVKVQLPDVYKNYIERNSSYQIPNGESLVDFSSRIINAYLEIAEQFEGESLLTIAHGGVLDCIIRHIFSIDLDLPRVFSLFNTSVNTIEIENQRFKLIEWGNMDHIQTGKALDEIGS